AFDTCRAPEQVIDDGGEPESGAGPFLALIENHAVLFVQRQVTLSIGQSRELWGQRSEPRLILPIAKVDSIRSRIECLAVPDGARHGGLLSRPQRVSSSED